MSNELQGIWTQYGKERDAAARAGGDKLNITHAAVGSGLGAVPVVSPAQTALKEEVWRGPVNGVQVNPEDPTDVIVDVVLPNDIGGFWIREWGLFDDAGKLVAVGPHSEMHKPVIASGQAAEMLERFHLPVKDTGAVNLTIASQALATQNYVKSKIDAHNADVGAHDFLVPKIRRVNTEYPLVGGGELSGDLTIGMAAYRKIITEPLTLFVRAHGNNNNDGLEIGSAWKDPLEAAYYINNKIDLASTFVTLDVGPGTFDWDSAVALAPLCSGAGGNMQTEQTRYAVRIIGAGQDSTIFRDSIQVGPASAYIKGLKTIPGTSRVTCAFEALRGANLMCEDVSCELNDTGNNFVRGFGSTQSQLSILGNTKISGTRAYSVIHGSYQSSVNLSGTFSMLNSAMVVSGDVLRSISNSYFIVRATYSGTCVGKKYNVNSNSGLDTAGTYNNIPGSVAGTVGTNDGSWIK